MTFNDQPTLRDDTYLLRPLTRTDQSGLREAADDPKIWEQHPIKDRHKREVFDPYFDFLMENGGTLIVTDRQTGQIFGCSRYYEMRDAPNSISIGYTFLIRDLWGGPANKAIKALMLTHAFESFEEFWLHIGPDNIRSQKATERIGARYVKTAPTQMVGSTGEMAWYKMTRTDWNG